MLHQKIFLVLTENGPGLSSYACETALPLIVTETAQNYQRFLLQKRNKKNVRFRSHQRICESTVLCIEEGERDDKVASPTRCTLHADRPTVLLNDALGNG